MDNLRLKWDNIFLKSGRYEIIMKIICALMIGASVYRMLTFYSKLELVPMHAIVQGQMIALISIGSVVLSMLSPRIGIIMVGLAAFLSMSGTAPILVLLAVIIMTIEGITTSTVHCMIIALMPLCMMTSAKSGLPVAAYFIFALAVFCGHKMSSTPKYASIVSFSLLAFVSGIYIANGAALDMRHPLALTDAASTNYNSVIMGIDFDMGFEQATGMALQLIVVIVVNIIIAVIAGKLLVSDNPKISKINLDIREAGIFGLMAVLLIVSGLLMKLVNGLTLNMSVVQVVIQILLAYIITRPFTSYKITQALSQEQHDNQLGQTVISTGDVIRSTSEEVSAISEVLSSEKNYNKVIFTGQKPVKTLLMYSTPELNKQYVVENIASSMDQKVEYLDSSDLLRQMADSGELDLKKDEGTPTCFFINHFDKLFGTDAGKKAAQKLMEYIGGTADDRNAMFILAADEPSVIPDECYDENKIGRVIHAKVGDSITFNDTYAVLDAIGKGGFGEVFSAWHSRLNEKVVLKKVAVDQKSSVSGKREVELLKRVKHMYLPKIYDVFDADQALYLVTDFIPGRSFADYLREGRKFEQKYVLIWAKQLAEAVSYLHGMQPPIVHSDIKPGNIMLTPDGDICLIDFNISAILDKGTAKSVGTTPGYSPIEQYGYVKNYLELLRKRGVDVDAFSRARVGSEYLSKKLSEELSRSLMNSIPSPAQGEGVSSIPLPGQNSLDKVVNIRDTDGEEATVAADWEDATVAADWEDETAAADWEDGVSTAPNRDVLQAGSRDVSASSGASAQEQMELVVDNKSFLIDCIQKGYGPRSDIYAIGATLYHLLTGVRPSINFFAIRPAHEYTGDIAPDFAAVIETCMRIDPDERYQDIEELRRALDSVRL